MRRALVVHDTTGRPRGGQEVSADSPGALERDAKSDRDDATGTGRLRNPRSRPSASCRFVGCPPLPRGTRLNQSGQAPARISVLPEFKISAKIWFAERTV